MIGLVILTFGVAALILIAIAVLDGCLDERYQRRREARIERVEQRMIELNHRDVAERSHAREFGAWDADADLATVLPFERTTSAEIVRIPTDLMDHDGLGAA